MEHEDAQLFNIAGRYASPRTAGRQIPPAALWLPGAFRATNRDRRLVQETWVGHSQHEPIPSEFPRVAVPNRPQSDHRLHPPPQTRTVAGAAAADGAPVARLPPAPGLTPAAQATGRDLGQNIVAAVSQLPPEQQEVFWLRMEANLPFREIARIQRCSINTALARMQYALTKLRTQLAPIYREWQENSP